MRFFAVLLISGCVIETGNPDAADGGETYTYRQADAIEGCPDVAGMTCW